MATFRHILIIYLICGACCAEEAITFTTKSGRELHDVVVTRIDGQFVLIRHSKGVARLALTEIPSDVRARLGMQGNALLDASAASIEELKPVLELQLAKDLKSIGDFESSYESHLQKLAGQAQKAGQLEHLMLVKAEIESFRKGTHQDSSAYPDLQKLQSIYINKRPGIVASATSKQTDTMRLYLGKLDELKKVLTQQGNLDKAVEVAEEEKRVHQLIGESKKLVAEASNQPEPSPAENQLPTLRVVGTWMKTDTETRFKFKEDGTFAAPRAQFERYEKGKWTLKGENLTLFFPYDEKRLRFSSDDLLVGRDGASQTWTLRRLR